MLHKIKVLLGKPDPTFMLWLAASAILLLPNLFTRGMFLDGLVYSSISRNLAEEVGEIWHLQYTNFHPNGFVDHPPLFIWIEAFFFRIFDDFYFLEKILSLSYYVICSVTIYAVFDQFLKKTEIHLSMLFWVVCPTVHWSFQNNMMEMLLTILIVSSYGICHKRYHEKKSLFDIPLVALLFVFIFLTKGPIALGTLLIPLSFILSDTANLKRITSDFAILLIVSGVLLSTLLLFEESFNSLQRWFDSQILGSFSRRRKWEHADSKLSIIWDLIQQILIPLAALAFLSIGLKVKPTFKRKHVSLLLIGLFFSLPFAISPKQHAYYLMPSLIFYCAFLTVSFVPNLNKLSLFFGKHKQAANGVSLIIITIAAVLSLSRIGIYSREELMQKDLALISKSVSTDIITVDKGSNVSWSLHAYAMRTHSIHLVDKSFEKYMISERNEVESYKKVSVPTTKYHLFERVN